MNEPEAPIDEIEPAPDGSGAGRAEGSEIVDVLTETYRSCLFETRGQFDPQTFVNDYASRLREWEGRLLARRVLALYLSYHVRGDCADAFHLTSSSRRASAQDRRTRPPA